jgi:hypothetical protein
MHTFLNLFTPENAKRISITFFTASACLRVKNWKQAGERGMIRSYIICKLHQTLYIGMMKSRTVMWVGRLVCTCGTTNEHNILVRRLEKGRPLDRPRIWQEATIEMDLTEVEFKCKFWIQVIRTILFLVAFDSLWTCREIKPFQRNTLSPSSMYFVSEHGDIFLPIDGIDLQAHSVNTQNNNTVVFTAARTPSVIVYNYYFYRNTNFVRSLEGYDDSATHTVKMFFLF